MGKKYYSISEVSKILEVKEHTLRNLDSLLGKKLTIIRGRRYYKGSDIEKLKAVTINSLQTIEISTNSKALTKTQQIRVVDAETYNDKTIYNSSISGFDNIKNLMRSMMELRTELTSALE